MIQLGPMDAAFLSMETRRAPMHTCGLMFLNPKSAGKDWGINAVRAMFEQRLHLAPVLRRRLKFVPGGIDFPYWIEDEDFDINYHLRLRALPRPGTDEQLEELVCQLTTRTLDRSRPLWEMYLIEGHHSGHMVMMSKIHHACIDGVSGAQLMEVLLDPDPAGRPVTPPERAWRGESEPSDAEVLLMAARHYIAKPKAVIDSLPNAVATLLNLGKVVAAKGIELPKTPLSVPRSLFNKRGGQVRAFAWKTLSLSDVRKVKDAFGVSVNDVVMALCAEAMRQYCVDRGELPEKAMVAAIPVSVRTEAEKNTGGNSVSGMFVSLATDDEDRVERLRKIHASALAGRQMQLAIGAKTLTDLTQFVPPRLLALGNRATARIGTGSTLMPFYNVVISNVPGPRQTLYWAGAEVIGTHPVSITVENCGINITLMSYKDGIDVGIVTDKGMVPDPETLTGYMANSLEQYLKLAPTAKPISKRKKAA